MHILEEGAFKDLELSVSCENRDQIMDIMIRLYRKHIQSKVARTGNLYQKTNLAILWFLNITRYFRQMILAYFTCKMALDDRMDREYYCDNCMYNHVEVIKVPDIKRYHITARLGMIYTCITENSDLLLFCERQKLLAANLIRGPQTTADQTRIYKEVLKNIALWTWPDNRLASLNFSIDWRQ